LPNLNETCLHPSLPFSSRNEFHRKGKKLAAADVPNTLILGPENQKENPKSPKP
jgi:hypothetical protein